MWSCFSRCSPRLFDESTPCHGIFVLMLWLFIFLDVMVLVILLLQSLVIFSRLRFLQLLFYLCCPLLDVLLLLM